VVERQVGQERLRDLAAPRLAQPFHQPRIRIAVDKRSC
jgi:hypothetical protein